MSELLAFLLQDPMLQRLDYPTSAKDPANPPTVENSLGAVGSCGNFRTPSPTPRSAPDLALSLLILAPNQTGNRKEGASIGRNGNGNGGATCQIGAKSDRKWNRWRCNHVISYSFGRQTTGNRNDGAPVALRTGYRMEGPTWHRLLWSI